MMPSGYNNSQLALILAVETLRSDPKVECNQAEWVIEIARKYEEFLSRDQINISNTYDVILETQGASTIDTIRAVSALANKSIKEVRDLLMYLPCSLELSISFEEALMIKNQLATSGSVARIEKVK